MQEGGWRHITDTNCTQPLHLLRGTRVTLQPINIQLWSTDTPLRFISPILCPLFIACWLSATPSPPPLQHHSSISAVLFFFPPLHQSPVATQVPLVSNRLPKQGKLYTSVCNPSTQSYFIESTLGLVKTECCSFMHLSTNFFVLFT